MGTWGTGIFDDDLTCDVRDTFQDVLSRGGSVEAATAEVLSTFGDDVIGDSEDEPKLWLALAAAQLDAGMVTDEIRQAALRVIDDGTDLRNWEAQEATPDDVDSRSRALQELRVRLTVA